MKRSIYKCIATMFCSVVVAPVFGQTPPPPPTPDGEDPLPKGASVQMRGPVHEAFAQPYVQKPSKGFELPQAPPKPIEELPPSIGPKDDDRD